jgi:uncharacterized protein YkwD
MHALFRLLRHTLAATVLTAIGLVAVAAAPPAVAATNCSPSSSWGSGRADLAAQVVGLINQHRAAKGLSQLVVSAPLTASSAWKSLHMAGNGYFDHNDQAPPVARTAYQRARDCDYAGGSWGENIAWGYSTAQSVVNGWLGSSGHRANIENANFTSTGVGVAANAGGQLYWTQNFGNDVSGSTPPPPPAAPNPPSSTPQPSTSQPPTQPPASSAPPPTPPAPGAAPPPARAAASTPSARELRVGAMPARVTRLQELARVVAAVSFVQMGTGRPVASGSVRCRAEVDGRRLRVLANAFRAQSARCAWRIPTWARGKQLTGVVALQIGDRATTRLFMILLA